MSRGLSNRHYRRIPPVHPIRRACYDDSRAKRYQPLPQTMPTCRHAVMPYTRGRVRRSSARLKWIKKRQCNHHRNLKLLPPTPSGDATHGDIIALKMRWMHTIHCVYNDHLQIDTTTIGTMDALRERNAQCTNREGNSTIESDNMQENTGTKTKQNKKQEGKQKDGKFRATV